MRTIFILTLLFFCAVFAHLGAWAQPKALIYYPFTGNAEDSSGNNYFSQVYGGNLTSDQTGNSNRAYQLSKVGQYIEIINSENLDMREGHTLAAWVYRSSGRRGTLISKLENKGYSVSGYELGISGIGKVEYTVSSRNTFAQYKPTWSSTKLDSLKWVHVAVVFNYSANNIKFYINGVLDTVWQHRELMSTNTLPIVIGQRSKSQNGANFIPYNGKIDNIYINLVPLSDADIQSLYVQCSPPAAAPIAQTANDSLVTARLNPGSRYLWRKDNEPLPDTTYSIKVNQSGAYSVQLTDKRGCKSLVSAPYFYQTSVCSNMMPPAFVRTATDSLVVLGTSFKKYLWYRNGILLPDTTAAIKANYGGYYTMKTVDSAGCLSWLSNEYKFVYQACALPPAPVIEQIGGDTLRVAAKGAYYQWYRNGLMLPDSTASIFVGKYGIGMFAVKVVSATGCFTPRSAEFAYPQATSIEPTAMAGGFTLYPNPSTGLVYVKTANTLNAVKIQLISTAGQVVYQWQGEKLTVETPFYFGTLPVGLYMLRLVSPTVSFAQKIVLQ